MSPHQPSWCSPGAGTAKEAQACGITYPLPGSLCVHASERRQQEFEVDAVFGGEATQVGEAEHRPLSSRLQLPADASRESLAVCALGSTKGHIQARGIAWLLLPHCHDRRVLPVPLPVMCPCSQGEVFDEVWPLIR